jgi:hypothetical protein
MNTESKTVAVPVQIPILIPSEELYKTFEGKLPATTQKLVSDGWLTLEEAVSYHQYHLMVCELASNKDEFLNMYRQVKAELARQASGIILPNGY